MYVCVYINMNNMNLKLTLIDKLEIFKTVYFFVFIIMVFFSFLYFLYTIFISQLSRATKAPQLFSRL